MADFNYTGITPSDITTYRDQLNKLLGTDQISGVWTPPKSPLTYTTAVSTPATVVPPTPTTTPPVTPPTVTPSTTTPSVSTMQGATNASKGGYVVKAGDTLGQIASGLGMTVAELAHINQIADPNKIQVGQILITPAPSGSPTTPTGSPAVVPTPVVTTPPAMKTPVVTTPTTKVVPTGTPVVTPAGGVTTPPSTTQDEAIKKQAEIAGRAGLSLDDWTKMNAPTAEESQKIADELGITKLEGEIFKKPSQTSQQVYETAYSTSGLADVKAQIIALNNEVNKAREDLRVSTGKIDENPFLTEASRVGRGKRLLAQSEALITNKLDQMNRLQGLYDKGLTEINGIITRNTADFGVNQQIDQAQLNYLQKKAETLATKTTAEKSAKGLPTFLATKVASAEPKTIGSEDMGYFRWDPTLKKFIQVIKPSGMAGIEAGIKVLQGQKLKEEIKNLQEGKGGQFSPTADQKSLVGRFLSTDDAKKLGATADDFTKAQTDPQFFYYLLQKATESGLY